MRASLADLLARISTARNTGQQPFNEEPFRLLVQHQALQTTSDYYRTINKAHHRPRDITANDAKVADAQFNTLDNLIDACGSAYARFLGRIPDDHHAAVPTAPPPAPLCQPISLRPLKVLPPLAAQMDFTAVSEPSAEQEEWDLAVMGNVALFAIGANTLGIACLMGQTAIVAPDEEPTPGDLVVVHCGDTYYARRLGIDRRDPARLILESLPAADSRLPPTQIVPRYASRIMKIVGVLFDQHSRTRGEAALVDTSNALRSIRYISLVRGPSAYPLAPDGSRALLSRVDAINENELNSIEGGIVAVATSDSPGSPLFVDGYLKRLGPAMPGFPSVRSLDNIGLQGKSLHVHFPSVGESPSPRIPSVLQFWLVNGVLY